MVVLSMIHSLVPGPLQYTFSMVLQPWIIHPVNYYALITAQISTQRERIGFGGSKNPRGPIACASETSGQKETRFVEIQTFCSFSLLSICKRMRRRRERVRARRHTQTAELMDTEVALQ